jgi:DNA/RNA endonuclease YhcR with UshA esterase domain
MKQRIALFAALLFAVQIAAGAQTISIADARNLPLGTVVTVEGSVTVPSGSYTSSTFDQGFAIQDETAGIYVSSAFNSGLNFHHHVRVTGVLDDDGFGLLVLRPSSEADVVKIPGATNIAPVTVATGDVSEATEGLLIEVEGIITRGPTDDLPFGYSVFIDDGSGETQIFIPATTGVNPFNIPWVTVGNTIRVTGFSAQFLSQYEVLPRFHGDFHPVN